MTVSRLNDFRVSFTMPTPAIAPVTSRSNTPSYERLPSLVRGGLIDFIAETRALRREVNSAIDTARGQLGTHEVERTTEITTLQETVVVTPGVVGTVSTASLGLATYTTDGADRPLVDIPQFDGVVTGIARIRNVNHSVNIAVDTVNTLVAKFDTAAGMASTLTALNELTLSRDIPSNPVTIQSDSSGFLLATGVVTTIPTTFTGVNTSPAMTLPDLVEYESERVMADTTAFSGVVDGQIMVNGQTVVVDKDTMSMIDVLDAITATGVATASYDGDVVTLTSQTGGALTLSSDSSGFLSALGLAPGSWGSDESTEIVIEEVVTTEISTEDTSRRNNGRLMDRLERLTGRVSGLFRPGSGDGADGSPLTILRDLFASSVLAAFDGEGTSRSNDLGFAVDFTSLGRNRVANHDVFRFSAADQRVLSSHLDRSPDEVRSFLLGQDEEPGLLDRLDLAITDAHEYILEHYGPVGGLVRVEI